MKTFTIAFKHNDTDYTAQVTKHYARGVQFQVSNITPELDLASTIYTWDAEKNRLVFGLDPNDMQISYTVAEAIFDQCKQEGISMAD